jgi:hypothetical protein
LLIKIDRSLSIAAVRFGDAPPQTLDFPVTLAPDLAIEPRADVFARAFSVEIRIAAIAVSPHCFDPSAALQLNDRRLSDDVPEHIV